MRPVLLPLVEHAARLALSRAGVMSRPVRTPVGEVHSYDAPGSGELPTTVFLHGLGSAATPFAPVFSRVRRHVRRIVAPDYPGHGFSEASSRRLTPEVLFDAVRATLDTLVDEPIILVGNSLGGGLALEYALERPSKVRALVLLSPAGARSTEDEWDRLRRSFDLSSRADAHAFCRKIYHRTPWFLPLVLHELPRTLVRPAVRELLEAASNDTVPPSDALRTLPMPILLMWGKSERLLPETHLDYFRQHLPEHAVFEQPVGLGHCPHLDAPAALARRIVAFGRAAEASATDPPRIKTA